MYRDILTRDKVNAVNHGMYIRGYVQNDVLFALSETYMYRDTLYDTVNE